MRCQGFNLVAEIAPAIGGRGRDTALPITIDPTGATARTAGRRPILDGKLVKKLSKSYQFYGCKPLQVVYSSANREIHSLQTKGIKMTTNATYAELLKEVSISITPNDATFLAELVKNYMSEKLISTGHMRNLIGTLEGSTYICTCQSCKVGA